MASPRDIVVVGAGVIGCAVACELARRGASVRVIDDRLPGMGATQASAGMLAPFIEAADGGPLLTLTSRSLALFDGFVSRLASDGEHIAYQRTGTLDVAMHHDRLSELALTAAVLASHGIAAELLDAAAVRQHEPELSDDVIGGLLIATHGFVQASEFTRALAVVARRHGARFASTGRVRDIEAGPGGVTVFTEGESMTADAVVLAAGSWSGQVPIGGASDRVPVRPIRGQLLHLDMGHRQMPLRRVLWGEGCYMVPWADGSLLVGATIEDAGFDERITVAGVRQLIEAAGALVPRALASSFVAARVGLRPGTPDGLPIIGRSAALPHLIYATGHFRNGVLLSPLTAQLVADLVLNEIEDPLLQFTGPHRFGDL